MLDVTDKNVLHGQENTPTINSLSSQKMDHGCGLVEGGTVNPTEH